LAGDTMLGRGVAEALAKHGPTSLVSPEVAALAKEADLLVLNLECCISARGEPWPDPGKPFFFRAPPAAVDLLVDLGVDCVTLANNHALDFGAVALADTLDLLDRAGIAAVGAGENLNEARRSVVLDHDGFRLRVVAFADHPAGFAATARSPGIALAEADGAAPGWVRQSLAEGGADAALVSPHWGPNMTSEPLDRVRRTADALVGAGATLVAGHSAHVFHGVSGRVLYDLGDFIDDYAVDPRLRNDLGAFFIVDLDAGRPRRLEAIPLALDFCHTRLATGEEWDWVARRFATACAALGTEVRAQRGRLTVDWTQGADRALP
jgi:poly-gamma-glutamate capsule biosynthesis protein CapA/YwtB (metallophosphatase superfamily)